MRRPREQNTTNMTTWKRPYLFPLFGIAAALLFGGLVMLLWNAIIPGLTGWALLTYPKAIGLLVLCRILFGGFHRCGGGAPWRRGMMHGGMHWRKDWAGMSDEERARLKEEWKKRCGPRMPEE